MGADIAAGLMVASVYDLHKVLRLLNERIAHPCCVASIVSAFAKYNSGLAKACVKEAYFRPRKSKTWSPSTYLMLPKRGWLNWVISCSSKEVKYEQKRMKNYAPR